ncbi:TPA: S41 family peptidase [Bacillus thuringiensis]|nr:hypothetical protein [Bacillus cereus]HDR4798184.1 hypothetical protein [Bacillus cereus]HDR4804272.1 hypothetical protein [Bacillus cereus]HDR4810280.1 hypothetical protein [Bacillus cereus]HDR4833624.1 hypothetical protein [Bacillus cereus]
MNQRNVFLAESLIKIVNQNYLFTGNQKKKWDRLSSLYLRKIKDSKVDSIISDLIQDMVLELHDPHTLFFQRKELRYCFDINVQWINNELFLMKNKNGYPDEDYIGSKILKVNSFNIIDELKKQQKRFAGFPTSIIRKSVIQNIIEGKYGAEKLKILVETIDKKRKTFVTYSQSIEHLFDYKSNINLIKNSFKPIIFETINKDTLLIKILTFKFPGMSELFVSNLRLLKGFKNIIFDIRDNSGGYVSEAKQILSFIISKNIHMDYKIIQRTEGESKFKVSSIQVTSNQISFFLNRKLFILCNSGTASSAEFIFLKGLLLSNQDITIVGEKTAGLSGQAKIFTIDENEIIQVTTKKFISRQGKEIKEGIQPDYTVIPLISDVINNRDTILNFVLKKIN